MALFTLSDIIKHLNVSFFFYGIAKDASNETESP